MRLIKVSLLAGMVAVAALSYPPARKYIQNRATDFCQVFNETEYDLRAALLPKTIEDPKGRHCA